MKRDLMDDRGTDFGITEFEVRGVIVRMHGAERIGDHSAQMAYAASRLPYSNGKIDRIGHKGLVVEMDPDGSPNHETFISPGVEVGTGVRIGAHTQVGAGVVIGPGVSIGRDCKIGNDSYIGTDVEIGQGNHIPANVILHNKIVIPDRLFTAETSRKYDVQASGRLEIDQLLVDTHKTMSQQKFSL